MELEHKRWFLLLAQFIQLAVCDTDYTEIEDLRDDIEHFLSQGDLEKEVADLQSKLNPQIKAADKIQLACLSQYIQLSACDKGCRLDDFKENIDWLVRNQTADTAVTRLLEKLNPHQASE